MSVRHDESIRRVGDVVRVVLVGGVAAAVTLLVSYLSAGLLEAGSFLIAIAFAAITLGIATEMTVSISSARFADLRRTRGLMAVQRMSSSSSVRCGSCLRLKTQVGSIWVCAHCDHIAVPR